MEWIRGNIFVLPSLGDDKRGVESMNLPERNFVIQHAIRSEVPLFFGLFGPSNSGKTFSALRIARGIQKVKPGPIMFLDTENRRALHYADMFDFEHIDFRPPFGSLDYLKALQDIESANPSCIIVDSMSHEHDGEGGLIDYQEKEVFRMAGNDYEKQKRVQGLAWSKPKQARRKLLNGILRLNTNIIFCFRAKQSTKPVKNPKTGKQEFVQFGFVPIAGDEFSFEMTINCFLPPHSRGIPDWNSDLPGERLMMKLPEQFIGEFDRPGIQLDESIGEELAIWAKGNTGERPQAKQNKQPNPGKAPRETGEVNSVLPGELIESVFKTEEVPEKKLILEWALVQNEEIQNHVAEIILRSDIYDNSPQGRAEKMKEYLRIYILHPRVRGHKLDDGRYLADAFDQSIKTETDIRKLWKAVQYGYSVIGGK
jgi:ribosomal protein S25